MITPASTRIDLDRFLALKTAAERRLTAGVKAPAAPSVTPVKTPAARPMAPETGLLSAYGAARPAAIGETAAPRRALGNFFDAVA